MSSDPSPLVGRWRRAIPILVTSAAVVALAWLVVSRQQNPTTFEFTRSAMLERWNAAATAADRPEFLIDEFQWTDEEAGVFGVAFSETMSLLGRVDGTVLDEVEEIALVGSRPEDGTDTIVAGMELVVRITAPELSESQRARLLSDLTLTGTVPADPDQRVTVGTTRFRVAADPANGILGIGAQPTALDD